MRDLRGAVVVVTGAGSGIGRATAEAFAAAGARVHAVDLDADLAEQTARSTGGAAHTVDVRDAGAVKDLIDGVVAREGRVDVLHNNAGVGIGKPVEETTLEDWRWVLDVNLNGVVHGVHAVVPHMLAAGRGTIVNTASILGLMAAPRTAPYTTSKFAVVGLSEALDLELRPKGIRVIAICPGIIATNIIRDGRVADEAKVDAFYARWGSRPEAVAADVVAAVRRGRPLVPTPGHARALYRARRLSGRLQRWLVSRFEGGLR